MYRGRKQAKVVTEPMMALHGSKVKVGCEPTAGKEKRQSRDDDSERTVQEETSRGEPENQDTVRLSVRNVVVCGVV